MADDVVDSVGKKVLGVGAGGVVGGVVLAPLVIGGLAAAGYVLAAPITVPLTAIAILGGMWFGHKATT